MQARRTLAFKLAVIGLSCLGAALASIALTVWATWQIEGGAAAVNEAGRLRMMSYRLAFELARADTPQSRTRIGVQAEAMDATLELLRRGDPARPLFIPWNEAAREGFQAVRQHWSTLRGPLLRGDAAGLAAVADFADTIDRFVAVVEHRLTFWTAVLRGFQFAMLALAIAGAMLTFYVAHMMVLEPLRRLGSGVASVRAGDLAARVPVLSADEFGELSTGFNGMAERLQAQYRDLETTVEEKTARLEVERARLASLYEVSAFVARAETLDELARGFVAKLRRICAADAVAVRWSDDANEHYLMLAHDGLPPTLADDEQCLLAGDCHCGRPAPLPGARVIPIHADARTASRCHGAGFEMLVTVPVRLHHRILGEIDLFYRHGSAPGDEERTLIETLASHLAGGIEALRAAAADKEAAVSEERALIARELHDSIAQSLAFLRIQVELLRSAETRGLAGPVRRAIDEIDTGVRECYGDVRELLLHFRTRPGAGDIEHALRTTLQKFEHQSGLRTHLAITGHGVPLPADAQVQVLHVVQEALSNVRKHAGASEVCVSVQQAPHWRFEVADNGCGFDPQRDAGASHVGLRIMRERAERIGADVALHSRPGAGTQVVLSVPRLTPIEEPEPLNEPSDTTAGG